MICKQNTQIFTSEKLFDLIVIFLYKYQFMDVYRTASYHFVTNSIFKTFFEKLRHFYERALLIKAELYFLFTIS